MRSLRATLSLAAAGIFATACSSNLGPLPCDNDGECLPGFYCQLAAGAAQGICASSPVCSGGETACEGACFDTQTSAANCGSCGHACAAPDGGSTSCSSGSCLPACATPAVLVGNSCLTAPPAPGAVTAVGGVGQVALSWPVDSGASGYNIKHSTTSGGPYTQVGTTGSAAANAYTDTSVGGGTTYYYVVTATSAAGESAASAEASALTAPDGPAGAAAVGGTNLITLIWNRSPGATTYNIYSALTSGAEMRDAALSPIADPGSGTSVDADDSSLPNGVTFYYQIEAANASGGARSGEISATTLLPAPLELTATGSDSGISLGWNLVAGATSYTLMRASGSGAFAVLDGNASTPYIDTNALAGVQYHYQVLAVTAEATSLPSNTATAEATLAVPAGLTGAPQEQTVGLSWNTVAGATGYDVQRSQDGAAYIHIGSSPTASSNSYSDTALTPGTHYSYQVRAVAAAFQGAYSAALAVTTTLDVPTNLALSGATSTSQISLSWNATDGAGYDVRRSADNGTTYSLLGSSQPTTNTSSYSDTSVTPGASYLYTVSTWTADSSSAPSTPFAASSTLAAPTALQVVGAAAGDVQLEWTPSTGATSYAIFVAGTSGSFAQIGTSNTTSYTDTTAIGAVSYLYYVEALSGSVTSSSSNVVTVMIPLTTPQPLSVDPVARKVLWPPSSGAQGYNIAKSIDGGSTYNPISGSTPSVQAGAICSGSGAGAVCAFSEQLTPASSTVYYKVQAWANPAGTAVTSGFGGPVPIFTGLPPPTMLSSFTTATSAYLNWTQPADISEFVVLRATSASGPFVRLGGAPTGFGSGYVDCDLTPGKTYYYQVESYAGITAVSAPAAFPPLTTEPATLPAASTLTATADPLQGVVLNWSAVAGAGVYNIYRSDNLGAAFYLFTTVDASNLTYTDGNGNGSANFVETYAVEAVNGTTPAFGSLSLPVQVFLPYPVPPTGLTATASIAAGAPQITLSWQPPLSSLGYGILQSLDGHSWVGVDNVNSVTTQTETAGLSFGTLYYYTLYNETALGISANATLTQVMTSPPPAPTGLNISSSGQGVPQLSWNSVANLPSTGGYIVQRSTDGTTFTSIGAANLPNTVTTSFSDLTAPASANYYYRVAAWTPSSIGAWVQANVQISGVTAPTSFTASIVTPTSVTLAWAGAGSGYNVYRSSDGGSTWLQQGATVPAGTFKYVDSTVQPGAIYIYRVVALEGSSTTFSLPSAPYSVVIAPGSLQAGGGSGVVTLAWSQVANATSYNIYRGTSAGSGGNPPGGATPYKTTTHNSYTDSAIADGTYYYAVSAAVSGLPASIASAAVSVTSGSGGITGTDLISYYSEDFTTGVTSEATAPVDLSACAASTCAITAWYLQDGVWSSSPGVGTWDGNFAVPNVPEGDYLLQTGTTYRSTSARAVNLGGDELGRSNLVTITDQPTNLDISLTGLVAANPLDIFETFSMNGRNNYLGVTPGANSPAPGATSVTDLIVDTYPSYGQTLLDGSQGDDLEIYQLSTQLETDLVTSAQFPVQTMSREVQVTAPTQVNGVDSAISAALASSSNSASFTLNLKRSAYQALLPQFNPAAVNGWIYGGGGPFVDAQPAAGTGRGTFGSAGTPDLLIVTSPDPQTQLDFNLGTISFSSPFDPSWSLWGGTTEYGVATYLLPGQRLGVDQLFAFVTRDSLATINALAQSSSGLSPRLSPAQSPQINGANAFYEQFGTGPTPTISWQPPAIGTPSSYVLWLLQLTPRNSGVAANHIATFGTTSTQLTIPPGLITGAGGAAYYIYIEALHLGGPGDGLANDSAPMMTAKFFP